MHACGTLTGLKFEMLEPNDVLKELQELRDNGFLSDALLRRAVKDVAASDDRFDWVGVYLVNPDESVIWLCRVDHLLQYNQNP